MIAVYLAPTENLDINCYDVMKKPKVIFLDAVGTLFEIGRAHV